MDKIAQFWEINSQESVKCLLCPNNCIISKGNSGLCKVRENIDNQLFVSNYGQTTGLSVDPIEKKPLFHFNPFSQILSLGANSCNLTCKFCQNYSSSQLPCSTYFVSPEDLLSVCKKNNILQVAFTYTEPFTWYEYIYDSSVLLYENGVKVVLVTNGYVNQSPLLKILPYISAMNIDLKAYSDKFYREICGGLINPVMETIHTAVKNTHVEITTLVIESLNDDLEEMKRLFKFIQGESEDIPLHLSRYFPKYKLDLPATKESTIFELVKLGKEYLRFVYPGNVLSTEYLKTYCPNCNKLLIDRLSHDNYIVQGCCPDCNCKIYGVF